MFCEKCGTRIDDGQPFCPNCGNRLAAPAAPAAAAPAAAPVQPYAPMGGYAPAPAPTRAPKPARVPTGSPLDRFLGMSVLNKIFTLATLGLLFLGMVMSWLKVFGKSYTLKYGGVIYSKFHEHAYLSEVTATWLLVIFAIFSTLAITALCLYLLGMLKTRFVYLFVGSIAGTLFLLLVIKWLAGSDIMKLVDPNNKGTMHLSVAGWLIFLSEMGACAMSVLSFFFTPKE